ncbi:MoaD/ThiS family protein [Flavobacterium sp.]|uniref:MoaD/ThiS family protein n=1 Tax=Flavobacterium sp. TaxID=239 RepID=UPI001216383E|nr:MoaD/ThiS family protein [Flavobacterium sp.]RZJ73028.1 MAG: MoaD/ThiS family protein [Flavobacterium sp.]
MPTKVLSFGMLSEITGSEFSVSAEDTKALESELFDRFPKLSEIKFAIAVNKKIVHEKTPLSQTDEIALMPPYSGG